MISCNFANGTAIFCKSLSKRDTVIGPFWWSSRTSPCRLER